MQDHVRTVLVLGRPGLEGGLRDGGGGPAVHGGHRVLPVLVAAEYRPCFSIRKQPVLSA